MLGKLLFQPSSNVKHSISFKAIKDDIWSKIDVWFLRQYHKGLEIKKFGFLLLKNSNNSRKYFVKINNNCIWGGRRQCRNAGHAQGILLTQRTGSQSPNTNRMPQCKIWFEKIQFRNGHSETVQRHRHSGDLKVWPTDQLSYWGRF